MKVARADASPKGYGAWNFSSGRDEVAFRSMDPCSGVPRPSRPICLADRAVPLFPRSAGNLFCSLPVVAPAPVVLGRSLVCHTRGQSSLFSKQRRRLQFALLKALLRTRVLNAPRCRPAASKRVHCPPAALESFTLSNARIWGSRIAKVPGVLLGFLRTVPDRPGLPSAAVLTRLYGYCRTLSSSLPDHFQPVASSDSNEARPAKCNKRADAQAASQRHIKTEQARRDKISAGFQVRARPGGTANCAQKTDLPPSQSRQLCLYGEIYVTTFVQALQQLLPGREKVEKAMLLTQAADYISQLQVLALAQR